MEKILKLMQNDKLWYINPDNNMVNYTDTENLLLSLDRESFVILNEDYEPTYVSFNNVAADPRELNLTEKQKTEWVYRFKCTHCKNRNNCVNSFSLQSEWRKKLLECFHENDSI